ncbi:lipopolysaccharide biosynthesis protein [Variovorax sp. Root318D1]|uniref:lipopolysaccharide biosynthesis protein n=1 Tax=Variovorax sp. Root318D1 TaxID=1736513 RepID=UPI0009E88296|nr:oligosaccharide flippase family protein [Variovorax sp. Root318D1]
MNARVKREGLAKAATILASGTVISQGLLILALPLLTRIYSPNDFSVLATYASILAVVSGIACLRFELAILQPEKEEEALSLLRLSLLAPIVLSLIACILVWLMQAGMFAGHRLPLIGGYAWLLPVGLLAIGWYTAVSYWFLRSKKYADVSINKVWQNIASLVVQLGLGLASIGPLGLILGHVTISGAGVSGLLFKLRSGSARIFSSISMQTLKSAFFKFRNFPKYAVPESLANNSNIQIPIILIAAWSVGPEVGYLALASRVIQAPVALIGGALSQVYSSRAPEEHRAGELAPFTAKILEGLIRVGVGPLIFVGMISARIFPILFGAEWSRAGEIVLWMTPWIVMQFLASPISLALHIIGNQKTALLVQLTGLVLRVGAVFAAAVLARGNLVEVYALSGFCFYLIYLAVVVASVGVDFRSLAKMALRNWWIIAGWLGAALLVRGFLVLGSF